MRPTKWKVSSMVRQHASPHNQRQRKWQLQMSNLSPLSLDRMHSNRVFAFVMQQQESPHSRIRLVVTHFQALDSTINPFYTEFHTRTHTQWNEFLSIFCRFVAPSSFVHASNGIPKEFHDECMTLSSHFTLFITSQQYAHSNVEFNPCPKSNKSLHNESFAKLTHKHSLRSLINRSLSQQNNFHPLNYVLVYRDFVYAIFGFGFATHFKVNVLHGIRLEI